MAQRRSKCALVHERDARRCESCLNKLSLRSGEGGSRSETGEGAACTKALPIALCEFRTISGEFLFNPPSSAAARHLLPEGEGLLDLAHHFAQYRECPVHL